MKKKIKIEKELRIVIKIKIIEIVFNQITSKVMVKLTIKMHERIKYKIRTSELILIE
jgi:hypothetical protein